MKFLTFAMGVSALLLAPAPVLAASAPHPAAKAEGGAAERTVGHRPVLLISIDGFSPDSLFKPENRGLNIPVLRGLLREGSYAERVVNVNPTVTNPNHTSLVTGVSPAVHGVFNNRPFAATVKLPASYSRYDTIRVPTLWSAAKAAGLRTASLYWPVTQGAGDIDVNITSGDSKDDEAITAAAVLTIAEHNPQFLTVHYVSHDGAQHAFGPGSAEGNASIEKIDREIGKLVSAYRAQNSRAVIAVASDHGFDRTTRQVNLNIPFAEAGFISFTDDTRSEVKSWRAFAWYVGGSAMVVLHDRDDAALQAEVAGFLNRLARRPDAGIGAILGPKELAGRGLSEQARFVIALKPGYRMGSAMKHPFSEAYSGGSHGAFSSATLRPDMHSSFILVGEGIAANKSLGTIDIRQIAPTLARLMNVRFPTAQAEALSLGQ